MVQHHLSMSDSPYSITGIGVRHIILICAILYVRVYSIKSYYRQTVLVKHHAHIWAILDGIYCQESTTEESSTVL